MIVPLIEIAQDGFGTIIDIEDSSLWQPKNSKKNHRVYLNCVTLKIDTTHT